jgi:FtsZ-binding cell division protein ZapB|tara:strand:- start:178 stop:462 length:285 start_codon:yes stop_codon:yes gene_type:complete
MNISETSKISLDIKALIGMIIGVITVASIWFNLTAEIELLKIKVSKMDEKVQSNYTWVNNFKPPKQVQKAVDEINLMKLENAVLKYKVEQLQKK